MLIRSVFRYIAGVFLACGITANANAAFIPADIVWVIDDSVSMAADIAQVKANIGAFNTFMVNNGVDARYALVRYGGPNQVFNTYGHNAHASIEQDLTDFATFNAGGSPFQNLGAPTSAAERGSLATTVVFNGAGAGIGDDAAGDGVNFRANSVKNIILVTDEDDDSSLADFNTADLLLGNPNNGGALFNFIGRPGVGNTNSRYGVLANNHGGNAFDILAFRADPTAFFNNFQAVKLQEIQDAFAPEPTTLALLGIGLLAAGAAGRRRA